jgi:hypothetical protein
MDHLVERSDRKPAGAESRKALLRPSNALMGAAMSGLLGLGGGCDDTEPPQEEEDPESHEHDAEGLECEPTAGRSATEDAGIATLDAGSSTSGHLENGEVEKEISTEDVQHTHAELAAMCDQRNGYLEVHGSCSGVNSCQGFFYGDWEADSQLVEHTCSGVNGCAGLSCLVPAREDSTGDMTGEEIMKLDDEWYTERAGAYGPKACRTCHVVSEFNEDKQDYDYDYTKLKIPVMPNTGRNASNWLERSPLYQENLITFGARGMTEDGTRYSNMVSYAKLFSKEEIKRVVEYMRSFDSKDITFKEIKLKPGKIE